jgi:hypothetical protein
LKKYYSIFRINVKDKFLILELNLDTVKQRLKYLVELLSRGKHTVFAKKCGIPPSSFQSYIHGERVPSTGHLIKIITVYGINLNWLLIGKGEPFVKGSNQEEEATERGKVLASDPVVQLLAEEEERAGISLSPEQRTAILKILRELVSRDVRSIRELLRAIPGGQNQGEE